MTGMFVENEAVLLVLVLLSTLHTKYLYPSLNLTYSICGRKPKESLNYIGITEGVRGKQTIILN